MKFYFLLDTKVFLNYINFLVKKRCVNKYYKRFYNFLNQHFVVATNYELVEIEYFCNKEVGVSLKKVLKVVKNLKIYDLKLKQILRMVEIEKFGIVDCSIIKLLEKHPEFILITTDYKLLNYLRYNGFNAFLEEEAAYNFDLLFK